MQKRKWVEFPRGLTICIPSCLGKEGLEVSPWRFRWKGMKELYFGAAGQSKPEVRMGTGGRSLKLFILIEPLWAEACREGHVIGTLGENPGAIQLENAQHPPKDQATTEMPRIKCRSGDVLGRQADVLQELAPDLDLAWRRSGFRQIEVEKEL